MVYWLSGRKKGALRTPQKERCAPFYFFMKKETKSEFFLSFLPCKFLFFIFLHKKNERFSGLKNSKRQKFRFFWSIAIDKKPMIFIIQFFSRLLNRKICWVISFLIFLGEKKRVIVWTQENLQIWTFWNANFTNLIIKAVKENYKLSIDIIYLAFRDSLH